jgi:hypothetical protein
MLPNRLAADESRSPSTKCSLDQFHCIFRGVRHYRQVIASEHTPMGIPRNVKLQATQRALTVMMRQANRDRKAVTVRSHHRYDLLQIRGSGKMATQLCQKCKQSHPGRVCDYDEKGDCAETVGVNEVAQPNIKLSKDKED